MSKKLPLKNPQDWAKHGNSLTEWLAKYPILTCRCCERKFDNKYEYPKLKECRYSAPNEICVECFELNTKAKYKTVNGYKKAGHPVPTDKLVHETTKAHHDEYATITGGAGRAVLRKICMDLIGGDIEALKEAYLEDKNLNNIQKVLGKAQTLMSMKGFGDNPRTGVSMSVMAGLQTKVRRAPYHKQVTAMRAEFRSRCTENNLDYKSMESFIKGPYTCEWFLTFDMQAPAFVIATREGRAKWKEINGGRHSGGVSNSTICSGLKHVLIFDILGCEFIEEKR